MMRLTLLAVTIVCAAMRPACGFHQEELRLPTAAAGPAGLEALLIRPSGAQRYPLALISHGTSGDAKERRNLSALAFYRSAHELARRGFAALVVIRRGYGSSGGDYTDRGGCCTTAKYLRAARTSADDLRAAIAAMKGRSDVTTEGMIAIGVSSGGLATVALTSEPPAGLAAAINFAGGLHRASLTGTGKRNADDETALVNAFMTLGRKSRTPMLWIYAENDTFFPPDLARRLQAGFVAGGGRARLVDAPAFGSDGHMLFARGLPVWTTMVDDFLREQKLLSGDLLAAPELPPPPQLGKRGSAAFADYLAAGPHKAFAVSPGGAFGYRSAKRTLQNAQDEALAGCAKHSPDCKLYAIDNDLAAAADASPPAQVRPDAPASTR